MLGSFLVIDSVHVNSWDPGQLFFDATYLSFFGSLFTIVTVMALSGSGRSSSPVREKGDINNSASASERAIKCEKTTEDFPFQSCPLLHSMALAVRRKELPLFLNPYSHVSESELESESHRILYCTLT